MPLYLPAGAAGGATYGPFSLVQYKLTSVQGTFELDELPTAGNIIVCAAGNRDNAGVTCYGGGTEHHPVAFDFAIGGNQTSVELRVGIVGETPTKTINASWGQAGGAIAAEFSFPPNTIFDNVFTTTIASAAANTVACGAIGAASHGKPAQGGLVLAAFAIRGSAFTAKPEGFTQVADHLHGGGRIYLGYREHDGAVPLPGFTVSSTGTTSIIGGQALIK